MHDDDVPETRRGAAMIGADDIQVFTPRSVEQFFQLVGRCRFTVSVRLHGGILSAACGVPPLLLGYRDKHLDFVSTMGETCAHVSVKDENADEVAHAVSTLSESPSCLRSEVLRHALHWRAVLAEHAQQCVGGRVPRAAAEMVTPAT
jgi:polysaccharide pyruvyl transferase WcaK-like protein